MLYILILSFWNPDAARTDVHVLTGTDCIKALVAAHADGWNRLGILACEIDEAERA